MCGIVGYAGSKMGDRALKVVMGGLFRIRHRGYDSWGVWIRTKEGRDYGYHKSIKPIDTLELFQRIQNGEFEGDLGIGHTRWATHGDISETNAHPLFSCDGTIAVVHNGIIENCLELKERLQQLGHIFTSETDTEVIPHLIEEYGKTEEFLLAFSKAVGELRGTYAILAVSPSEKAIFAAKKDSPLIIALGKEETFISSDLIPIPALFDKGLIKLKDGDIALITEKQVKVWNNGKAGRRRAKKVDLIPWRQFSVDPFGDNITKWEIKFQSDSLEAALSQDKNKLERIIKRLRRARQIILTGSGSSYNAAVLGQYLFRSLGLPAIAVASPDLAPYEKSIDQKTVIMALSQSGETMDLIDGLKQVMAKRPEVCSLINVPLSTIEDLSEIVLPINCGPEFAVVATKSFTCQLIILYQLYYGLRGEPLYGRKMLEEAIKGTRDLIRYLDSPKMDELANIAWLDGQSFIPILGAGPSFSAALEASLKIDELAEIPTKAYLSQDFKHGPLQLIQHGKREFPRRIIVLAIAPNDEYFNLTATSVKEIRARGGYAVGITTREKKEEFNSQIIIPDIEASQILAAVASQILAYKLGEINYLINHPGETMDRPGNIAKTLTVK